MGPDPAIAQVRYAVRTLLMRERSGPAGRLLVACSGGADSLALAAATAFTADRLGLRAGLITIDHGLQPGSAEQAARVAALGYELGFDPVEVIRVDVCTAGGPEAAARDARYAALDAAAEALDADVLLGHTLDDQAETVLLGLGRGSGPRSIAGMKPVSGHYLRPLLAIRRATTLAACRALGLTPWADPHNTDPAFQRVRLRREVLPLLEDVLQGGVTEALARTAELVREDLDALDELAGRIAAGEPPERLPVSALTGQPRAVRTRVLRAWAASAGAHALSAVHLAALDALIVDWHGQGPVDLPGGIRAARASGKLVPTPQRPDQGSSEDERD